MRIPPLLEDTRKPGETVREKWGGEAGVALTTGRKLHVVVLFVAVLVSTVSFLLKQSALGRSRAWLAAVCACAMTVLLSSSLNLSKGSSSYALWLGTLLIVPTAGLVAGF